MGGRAGKHMPSLAQYLDCSPSAPVLSVRTSCSSTRALSGAILSPGQIPLSAVATAQELGGETHDRLRDVMPSAMQLQPLINLEVCPARLTPATSVAIVGGSCSVCRSDLSAIIAPAQGLHIA